MVLRNPTNREIADCLGFNEAIDRTQVRDVVIVGPDRLLFLENDRRKSVSTAYVLHLAKTLHRGAKTK
jgi:hypothetical protein